MDAIEYVTNDHRFIESLVDKFLQTESEITQESLFHQIDTALSGHNQMEERVLYAAVKPFAPDKVAKAVEEHQEVKNVLAELHEPDLNEERFESALMKLFDDIRSHLKKEEGPDGILDLARLHLGERRLAEMGTEMARIRQDFERDMAA